LKSYILVLFFKVSLEDSKILKVLRGEGHLLRKHTFVRLRFNLRLRRRIRSREAQQEANKLIHRLVKEELKKGAINRYSRQYLHLHFKQKF
ncbi:hypothetical protein K504DRAFT_385782, partial [Pleomassaria siparia CBS 279.74]